MDVPNFPHSFTTEILAYFSENRSSTNVMENSASFKKIAHLSDSYYIIKIKKCILENKNVR